MQIIEREYYLNKMINVIGTPDIKVITGVRRSGKSKLLEMFKEYITKNIKNYNIIHINFNTPISEELKDYNDLYNYVQERYAKNKNNFLLIDEVQMCKNFEKAINWLHNSEQFNIYVTGSNAFLLSSDLATLFTGRTFKIEIYPFSFKEFFKYYKYTNIFEAFDKYVLEGGVSGSYLYNEISEKYDYLNDVYNTLIVRDITQKYKIRNTVLMDELNNFLMDNISNLTSIRNITKILGNPKKKVSDKTIGLYLSYLCKAFAFYKIKRYDIQGKKYLISQDKYYLVDHSFKFAKLGTKNMNYGRIYENIVAIELLRRGYEVYVGVLYKKEIDFVALKRDEKIYIQVCDDLSNEETLMREINSLLKIKDAYPKILIARTKHDTYQYEGIKIIDIANWLNE